MNVNRVTLSGRVVTRPELSTTRNGLHVLKFRVAVNGRIRNSATLGWEERPNYFSCVVFGNRASDVSEFLCVGMRIALDGELRRSEWKDENGNKRESVSVVARTLDVQ